MPEEIHVFVVKSLEDFIKRTTDETIGRLYRGQPDESKKLLSPVGRLWPNFENTRNSKNRFFRYERDALLYFKRYALPHLKTPLDSELEYLALAQHHGVPTRLLDWSQSSLVGLFFAVNKDVEQNGAVFTLSPSKTYLDEKEGDLPDPFDVPGFRTIIPMAVTSRIATQDGVFTIQNDPRIPIEEEEEEVVVWKFIIPKEHKTKILEGLYRAGIHYASLFPDLDGVGKWVKYSVYR